MNYEQKLRSTNSSYPFSRWQQAEAEGFDQYSKDNCDRAKRIFDDLIEGLVALGEHASETDKLAKFEIAVNQLNTLNEDLDECFIETGEREDLCELTNIICAAAGLDPSDYGDGEGPASNWRDW